MEPLREIGRLLIVAGVTLVIVGAFLVFSGKLPFDWAVFLGTFPGRAGIPWCIFQWLRALPSAWCSAWYFG